MDRPPPRAARLWQVRGPHVKVAILMIGMILTVILVADTWTKAVGTTAILGSPGRRTGALGAVLTLAAALAGWFCGDVKLLRRPALGRASLTLAVIWSGVIAVSATRLWQIWAPAWLVIPLLVLASVHALWFLWMWMLPIAPQARFGVFVLLITGIVPFVTLFKFAGLSGDGHPVVTWRQQPHASTSLRPDERTAESEGASATETSAHSYAQFMGPLRTGVVDHVQLPDHAPREVWRREVGAGWSAFAVESGIAVTQEQHDQLECVVAYRLSDGRPLWRHDDPLRFESSVGGPGPRATPTIFDGRVYAVGATGRFNCLLAKTGEPIWSVDISAVGNLLPHGTTASPLVIPPQVIVCPAAESGPGVAAYDMKTGALRWQNLEYHSSYASPMYARIAGLEQVLVHQQDALRGFDLVTGATLWQIPWSNDTQTVASQPIVHVSQTDRVFVSTGYGTGCGLFDVLREADGWSVREVWTSRNLKTKFCSSIQVDGTIFGLDNGILSAVDVATGKLKWKQGRYGHGQLLCAGETLIVMAEQGYLAFVAADAEQYREWMRIEALTSKTWNYPALAWPYLLVRNDREAVCFKME